LLVYRARRLLRRCLQQSSEQRYQRLHQLPIRLLGELLEQRLPTRPEHTKRVKKGFEQNGVPPILPKLVRHSRTYLDGKKAADEQLEKAYTAAIEAALSRGDGEAVTRFRKEVKDLRAANPGLPDRATAKDEKVERDIARAMDEYAAAWTKASADLIAAIEEARTRV
jgi:hypothetical protein